MNGEELIKSKTLDIINQLLDEKITAGKAPFHITMDELVTNIKAAINSLVQSQQITFGNTVNNIYFTNNKSITHQQTVDNKTATSTR